MKGININCREQDFVGEILSGKKVVETRNRNTLKSLVGQRVGLIKTGCGKAMLMGYADIKCVTTWYTEEAFRADEVWHKVKRGSAYDIKDRKYGYWFSNVERCVPREVASRGIVIREV